MARFGYADANNYSTSTSSFFSLKNDKDIARVRFMYEGIEDVEGYSVHKVKDGDKDRYVNCLREYNQPIDDCPLCAANFKLQSKLFIKLYDVDTDEVKIWDRGKNWFEKISSLSERYSPLVAHEFEIERRGVKGDKQTTYEIFNVGEKSDIRVRDLPEAPDVMGTIVLDKSYDEMNFYLDNGYFRNVDEAPQRSDRGSRERNDEDSPRESRDRDSDSGRSSRGSSRNVSAGRSSERSSSRVKRNEDVY